MLIPYGVEDAAVRRWPLVTAAIMLACALVFLLTGVLGLGGSSGDAPQLEEVFARWAEGVAEGHAELRVPEACIPDDNVRQQIGQLEKELGRLGGMVLEPQDTGQDDELQESLDLLCDQVLEASSGSPEQRWGLVPARGLLQPGWLTHIFLHADWLHLLTNLAFFFLLCGPYLEDVWGRAAFAILFLVGGVGAGLAHTALDTSSMVPLIGASGAISAVMGAFCVRFAKRKVRFWYFFLIIFRPVYGSFGLPAWMAGLFWLAQDSISLWLEGSSAGVAFMAHIGGMIFGVLAALAFRAFGLDERFGIPLKDSYQVGKADPAELTSQARVLGVPRHVLEPPERRQHRPQIWGLYEKAMEACRGEDRARANRRLRYLVQLVRRPGDEALVAHLLAHHAHKVDPALLPAEALGTLRRIASAHGLEGPLTKLGGLVDRVRLPQEPLSAALPPIIEAPSPAPRPATEDAPDMPLAQPYPGEEPPPRERLPADGIPLVDEGDVLADLYEPATAEEEPDRD